MSDGLWRIDLEGTHRWAWGAIDHGPRSLLPRSFTLDAALADGGLLESTLPTPVAQVSTPVTVLPPLESQPVWAAGVTYLRSREARKEESATPDPYGQVYDAERPELFPKALPRTSRGPGQPVAVRADSTWDVPEPELGLVLDARGAIVAYTIGNDVSSRSIEGENPLYLPQAKIYEGSCAIGPALVPVGGPPLHERRIRMEILRRDATLFEGEVPISDLRRNPEELARWLFRAQRFPVGVVLLTGTALVPDRPFTLRSGDVVRIGITGLGILENDVVTTTVGSSIG